MSNRTSKLKICLNDEERRALVDAGARLSVGPSTFARMAALRAAGRKPAPPPRRKPNGYEQALAAWTAQLSWIGSNVNQCARCLNSGGSIDRSELSGIEAQLRALRETILAFDQARE
jgi:hypothetical protein